MIRVGTAGWSYADWEGRVYPRRKPRDFHPLSYLARYLQCMELNASFYAYPSPDHARHWTHRIEDFAEFRFTAKLHRDFTHDLQAIWTEPAIAQRRDAFLRGLEPLRESGRLSAVLCQFPVTFDRTPANRRHLARLAELFAQELPLVLELRHRSWFEPEVLRRFAERSLSIAHLDLPPARDHPPETPPRTGPIGYLRVHGRNSRAWFRAESTRDERYDYLYTEREVDELTERARRLTRDHDDVFVITNNHFAGQAAANALEIRARLETSPVLGPPELFEAYPHLKDRVRPDRSATLFD